MDYWFLVGTILLMGSLASSIILRIYVGRVGFPSGRTFNPAAEIEARRKVDGVGLRVAERDVLLDSKRRIMNAVLAEEIGHHHGSEKSENEISGKEHRVKVSDYRDELKAIDNRISELNREDYSKRLSGPPSGLQRDHTASSMDSL